MLTFPLVRCRFHFKAIDPIFFRNGKAANTIRGAFGDISRSADPSLFLRFFDPRADATPSGLASPPRPFVLRAAHLNGQTFQCGSTFYFDMHLFDLRCPEVDALASIFREFAKVGLGANRARVELTGLERTHIVLSLEPQAAAVQAVRVLFLTPTELKFGQKIVSRAEFPILFSRVRDRISTLRALYGDGPLPIDFSALSQRAAEISLTAFEHREVYLERRSSRTGQRHGIGGFVGSAEYEGELTEFIPYLEAACWTGVGRQTVWGKGQLGLEILAGEAQLFCA